MNLAVETVYDNWLVLLRDLISEKIKLTPLQEIKLTREATGWPTCACGQLCAALPKKSSGSGAPEDYFLYDLGLNFASEISRQQWAAALRTFERIEKRSTQLLRELNDRLSVYGATTISGNTW